MRKKCIHKCKWKKTGAERYSFPGQYEEECEACHKKRWKEYDEKIPVKKVDQTEWERYRKKFITGV